jgi:hypothetical protein
VGKLWRVGTLLSGVAPGGGGVGRSRELPGREMGM